MRIAVLGAGAMGSLFGGRLAEAGFDVGLIDVDAAHIEAVRLEGLRLEADDGERRIRVPIGRAESYLEPVDLLVVFTKAPHTGAALDSVRHLLGPASWALTLQNGLGNGERLAATLPRERILIGMTTWPASLATLGHVRAHGTGEVRLWTLTGATDAMVSRVCDALSKAGLQCTADPEVRVAIWEKVAFNAAMNSIAAAMGYTVGQMADDPDIQTLARAIAAEAAAVAQACKVAVSSARIEKAMRDAYATHRSHRPSMLQDILAGRPTEIESINGGIVAHAHGMHMTVPVTEVFLRLVRARERERHP